MNGEPQICLTTTDVPITSIVLSSCTLSLYSSAPLEQQQVDVKRGSIEDHILPPTDDIIPPIMEDVEREERREEAPPNPTQQYRIHFMDIPPASTGIWIQYTLYQL